MRLPLALLLLAAPPVAPAAAQDAEWGGELYRDHCAACHGAEATGDGPLAALLTVPPPDLTRLREADGTFPAFWVMRRIDGRDPFLAHGGEMPVWGEVLEGPRILLDGPGGQPILVAEPVAALAAWIESVQAD